MGEKGAGEDEYPPNDNGEVGLESDETELKSSSLVAYEKGSASANLFMHDDVIVEDVVVAEEMVGMVVSSD